MDVASLLLLLAFAALGWFWFNSLSALELARARGKKVCSDAHVQFLDDTVARISLALVRDASGRRVFRRTYRFEFSETGNSRLEGQLVVLGGRVESVTMEPYQILPVTGTGGEPAHDLQLCDDKNTFPATGGCCGGGCSGRDGGSRDAGQ
jgi:hypothetical protein